MKGIASESDDRLAQVDDETRAHLEGVVRELLATVDQQARSDMSTWPEGYFDETAGALADEPIERPLQGDVEPRVSW